MGIRLEYQACTFDALDLSQEILKPDSCKWKWDMFADMIQLYLKRDKIAHFTIPASKNQIPNINSYPMSIDNLKFCISMICDIGTCLELETRNQKPCHTERSRSAETRNQKPCHTELPALSLTKGSRSAETRNLVTLSCLP
jgi:hypothetical protein